MFYFDPMYFIFLGPAMLLAMWAQFKVKSAYASASKLGAASGLTGAATAAKILEMNGLTNVGIEQVPGQMSDHYDPKKKVLRLSPDVYQGRSLASLGIAAHEVGHALQDAQGYGPLRLRNGIVPLASVGGKLSFGLMILGFILGSMGFILLGIAAYSLIVIFQLVNLPVEYDASARAKEILFSTGMVAPSEQGAVKNVLSAAALTYVAATISAVLTLLYYLWRSGLLGGRRD